MIVTVVTDDRGSFVEGVYQGTPDEVMAKHFPQATRDTRLPGVYWEYTMNEGIPQYHGEAWHTFCHEVQD